MPTWKHYHLAYSVPDALQALANAPGPARLVAGGTDLLLDLQQGRHSPVHTLVDVTAIPELVSLEVRQDRLFLGAAVPLNHIVKSPLVYKHARALTEACELIGGPQVRNTATLGGNVAHALPAADGTIALLALDAVTEVATPAGSRLMPISDLFLGPGRSVLDPQQELLLGFHLPLYHACQASAFRRVMRPQGVALPILNMAVWLQREGEVMADIRLAIGPAGPTPLRAWTTEDVLRGRILDETAFSAALAALLEEAHFRTSPRRASAGYRRLLAGGLFRDVLTTAWERAA
jgi:xanthine dehydrogenase FAD-binding subunit